MSTVLLPYLDSAFNLASWLVGSPAAAQDIVQAAFAQACVSVRTLPPREPRLWLLRLVRETAYRRLHTHRGVARSAGECLAGPAGAQQAGGLLQALPVDLREMLVLRELECLDYAEIAQVVGLPVPAVLSTISAARQRVHELSRGSGAHDPRRARTNAASSASSRSDTAQNDKSPCVQ